MTEKGKGSVNVRSAHATVHAAGNAQQSTASEAETVNIAMILNVPAAAMVLNVSVSGNTVDDTEVM